MSVDTLKKAPEGFCKHGNATECVHCQQEAMKKGKEQKTSPQTEADESFGKKVADIPKSKKKIAEAETIYDPGSKTITAEEEKSSTPVNKLREESISQEFSKIEIPEAEQERMIRLIKKFESELEDLGYNKERLAKLRDLHEMIIEDGEFELATDLQGKNLSKIMRLSSGAEGIYKPSSYESFIRGGENIRGLEEGQAFAREWLCHHVELNLNFNIVPPTVIRKNSNGIGSVQEWRDDIQVADVIGSSSIPEREESEKNNKFTSEEMKLYWQGIENSADREQLISMAVFDFLTENTDRHPGNIGITKSGDVVAIDNGLSFPEKVVPWMDVDMFQTKDTPSDPIFLLSNLGGEQIPENIINKLKIFINDQTKKDKLQEAMVIALGTEVGQKKWKDFSFRLNHIIDTRKVPKAMYLY